MLALVISAAGRPRTVYRASLALTLLFTATVVAVQEPNADELKRLQGGWQVVAAEQRGKPFDAIKGGALIVEGNTFFLRTAAGNEFRGEIRLGPANSPKQLDFVHAKNGPVWEAIYTVTDDSFRLNYVDAGGRDRRPTLFATTADSAGTVIVMRRMAEH